MRKIFRSGLSLAARHSSLLLQLAAGGMTLWWVCTAHMTLGYLCDFSQHWSIGRMIATGRGRHLYDEQYQWDALRGAYGQGKPNAEGKYEYARLGEKGYSDDEIWSHVYTEDIGTVLYPPVSGFFYAPLGLIPWPKWADWALVELSTGSVVLFGWLVGRLTAGRLNMPLVVLLTLSFPNFFFTMSVGQNSFLTLALMTLGWYGMARGRPLAGGLAWGLLVYKPTWLAALGWIPVLLRQWRACAGIALSAGLLCLASLPVCGIQAWRDWDAVRRKAAHWYEIDTKQIDLSRDLMGLPRRIQIGHPVEAKDPEIGPVLGRTWKFHIGRFFGLPKPLQERMKRTIQEPETATKIGYALIAGIGLLTCVVTLWRGEPPVAPELTGAAKAETEAELLSEGPFAESARLSRRQGFLDRLHGFFESEPVPAVGPRAALLLLAGVLMCVHYMYYDASLVLLPLALALGDWPALSRWSRGILLALGSGFWILMLLNNWVTDLRGIPFSIFLTLGLWLWALVEVIRRSLAAGTESSLARREVPSAERQAESGGH